MPTALVCFGSNWPNLWGDRLPTYPRRFTSSQSHFCPWGHEERERFAAQFAQEHPDLKVWVSSGSPPEYARQIFANYQIEGDRLQLDYQAEDTVTNFTSLVDEFKQENIDSVYLITSENHMNRAKLVASIVFGTRDIAIKPVPVPSDNPPETTMKCIRDGLRSILWVVTGETGPRVANLDSDPYPGDRPQRQTTRGEFIIAEVLLAYRSHDGVNRRTDLFLQGP